ncbi:hypothetical protein NMG60_11013110 [Bertholletia excelsa]
MEEDDEFGDLYTDVLRPFQQSSVTHPPPAQPEQPSANVSVNINHSDDDEVLLGASDVNLKFKFSGSQQSQTLASRPDKAAPAQGFAGSSDSCRNLNLDGKDEDREVERDESSADRLRNLDSDLGSRVLESGGDVKSPGRAFADPSLVDELGIDVVEQINDKGDLMVVKKDAATVEKDDFQKFDIEEDDTGIGNMVSEPVIPGLSIPGISDAADKQVNTNTVRRDEVSEGDDWDSDSEDDLQIVLNDNNHGPMAMDRTGVVGSDDEDEDGDPLVIVADSEPVQPMEEQEWGDDAAHAVDGERKESVEAAKANGGGAVVPKIGYSNHAYHPYHSQFKYVRPGASPIPGAAPVGPAGAPGQVRPPVSVGPAAGRGRGDWWTAGMKNAPSAQKGFHPGYGMAAWGNNASGRGFAGGLEFTLPSHKTIFEVDVDSFEEKPWTVPGIDISDFFNFGFNEESWKDYCRQLEQLRLEATMQSKIRVYESGRNEQEYDPDLPPELAAASGILDISSENAHPGKVDAGPKDVPKGSARVRPPLPTGRAIQVETGSGERLPSIDTRPPRIRDSDAIIEIVLQDSADDDSFPKNDVAEQPENDHSRKDFRAGPESGQDIVEEDNEQFTGFPHGHNGRKKEVVGRNAPSLRSIKDNITQGDGDFRSTLEAVVHPRPDSRAQNFPYPGRDVDTPDEERPAKGRAHNRSPDMSHIESMSEKRLLDSQKEDSVESIGGKHSPRLSSPAQMSSPVPIGSAEPDVRHSDDSHGEPGLANGSSGIDGDDLALDRKTAVDSHLDENPSPSVKKQKLGLQVEQSSLRETDDGGGSKAAKSNEISKARSANSQDNQRLHDSIDEEVAQHSRSTSKGNLKRIHGEDEQSVKKKGRDERQEVEKHRMVQRSRENSYPRRDWDPHSVDHSHAKESVDRRKESENSKGAWQRRDDDLYGRRTRAEDTRKRERDNEMATKQWNKARESDKMDKDDHHRLRKQLDNGHLRGRHDKEVGSRHRERDDNLKSRHENPDDLHRKRRKDEETLRRDAEKEETLHGHRENTSRRKRERDDTLDQHKKDDQVRNRDEERHYTGHKEEGRVQRERGDRQKDRDDWHRLKKTNEESFSKREREEGRGGVRSTRTPEDKAWANNVRVKDEYKGSDRDYQLKDTGRHSEQLKRRDRVEDGSVAQHRGREDAHARGNQHGSDERRSRQERASSHSDRAAVGSDNNRAPDKKHKENLRKSKDSAGGDQNSMGASKKTQEDQSGRVNETAIPRGTTEQGSGKQHEIIMTNHLSRKHMEDISSDDEQQDSRRGRSKLERWTSHKERDFSISTRPSSSSSSLKVKEADKCNNGRSSSESKLPEESTKKAEISSNQHSSGDQKEKGDPEIKNADAKPPEDKHLDTVAKLKKRSERFKLPMPSEKEAIVIKKMESEPLPSAQSEARGDSEIKHERPARKRRWVTN